MVNSFFAVFNLIYLPFLFLLKTMVILNQPQRNWIEFVYGAWSAMVGRIKIQ
jgi:hypothetical protein